MDLNPEVTLFELGSLRVFHRPDVTEILGDYSPSKVWWIDLRVGNVYGPFESIYDSMVHYTWFAAQKPPKDTPVTEDKVGEVIHIDFSRKQRIIYNLPE